MIYTKEVEHMCPVNKGAYHGPAPVPQEGKKEYFGRTIVEDITGLKSTRASELIKLLVDSEIIVPVTGHGKGKYRFQL